MAQIPIMDLPTITEVDDNDYFIVETATETSKVKYANMGGTTKIIEVPVMNTSAVLIYNGTEQSIPWDGVVDTTNIIFTNNTATNAGTYTCTATLKTEHMIWADGTSSPKSYTWTINKATSTLVVAPTSITLNSESLYKQITIAFTGEVGSTVTLTNSDSTYVSMSTSTVTTSGQAVTLTATGTTGQATITATLPESTNYLGSTATCTVNCKFTATYTIRLDMSDSNPDTWCTRVEGTVTEVSVGGGENEIDEFMGYYPVVLVNGTGVEYKKINPANKAKYLDGTNVSTADGDCMVAFPSKGYKISWYDSTHLDVSITDEDNKTGYTYPTYKGTKVTTFYHSMYEGFTSGSKLRSWSGQTPTTNQTIGTFRTQAQANGTGYEQRTYKELTYLQCCLLIKYKGKNMQSILGRGFVDGNSASHVTGGTNSLGMNYGETTGKVQMSLFGIEDFWGNIWDFVDGIFSDASWNILVTDGNFNDTGSGYINQGSTGASANFGNYMSKPKATTTNMGFAPASDGVSGSTTTFFCDYAIVYASRLASFGGSWSDGDGAGAFRLDVYRAASNAHAVIGSRLMYFKTT